MVIVKAIHALSDLADKLCGALCVIILSAMVLVTGAQIVCRVFFTALTWSEEITRYLLIWSTLLGAGVVYKHAGHISVTILQNACPAAVGKLLRLLVHVICGAFCVVAVFYGFKYMSMQGSQLSAALRVPMRFMYMAVPVGCLVIDLHVIDAILQLFLEKKEVQA